MGSGGFIEPPPGLFASGSAQDDDARGSRDRLPANPFAPPGTPAATQIPHPAPSMPPQPAGDTPPAHPPLSVAPDPTQPSGSWVVRPADRPAPPLPAVPRLAPAPVQAQPAPVQPAPAPVEPFGAPATPRGERDRARAERSASTSLPEWSLVLQDGVVIPLYGPVIVGRNPSGDRFPGATLSAVRDETRTMSNTHARFYLDSGVPMLDDLDSTNGIALFPGGNPQGAMAVEPGAPVEVRSGDIVQLGEYEITIRRN